MIIFIKCKYLHFDESGGIWFDEGENDLYIFVVSSQSWVVCCHQVLFPDYRGFADGLFQESTVKKTFIYSLVRITIASLWVHVIFKNFFKERQKFPGLRITWCLYYLLPPQQVEYVSCIMMEDLTSRWIELTLPGTHPEAMAIQPLTGQMKHISLLMLPPEVTIVSDILVFHVTAIPFTRPNNDKVCGVPQGTLMVTFILFCIFACRKRQCLCKI